MSDIGNLGIVEIPASNGGIVVRVSWKEEIDYVKGTSTIIIENVEAKSRKWYGISYFLDGAISVNSQDIQAFNKTAEQYYFYWDSLNKFAKIRTQKNGISLPWRSEPIGRNIDGEKIVTLKINISGYTQLGGADSGWNASEEINIDLTKIEKEQEEITEPHNFISSFFFNGKTAMVAKNGKLVVAFYKPGIPPSDHSVLGDCIIGLMKLSSSGG